MLDALFLSTTMGQCIADASCSNPDTAISLAETGRYVWTFSTTDRALAKIKQASAESQARITASSDVSVADGLTLPIFDAIFLTDGLSTELDPLAYIRDLQNLCSADAPVIICIPNGARNARHGDTWLFHESTVCELFSTLGEVTLVIPPDRANLCIQITRRRTPNADRIRIAALLTLQPEDRWINDCLMTLDSVAAYAIAQGNQISERSLRIVRNHPRVLSINLYGALVHEDDTIRETQRRLSAWLPDWVLSLDSSAVLAPETPARLLSALRSAKPSTAHVSLITRMLWDREDQYRIDVPAGYSERAYASRPGTSANAPCESLDARIFDYGSLDKELRAARRALRVAQQQLGYAEHEDDWKSAATAQTAGVEEAPLQDDKRSLLAAVIETDPHDVTRGLCLDAVEFDLAAILKARWPSGTFTLFAALGTALHPQFNRYSFVIPDDITAIDVDLVCGRNRFDLVIDACASPDAGPGRSRLAQARRAVSQNGRLYFLFDAAAGTVTVDDMLAARAFSDAGLLVSSIESRRSPASERSTIVRAVPALHPPQRNFALTLVVPFDDADSTNADFFGALVAGINDPAVAVVAARFVTAAAARSSRVTTLPLGTPVVDVYEPALDAAVALAFLRAPAQSLCVLPAGTVLTEHWCARVVERLRTSDLGYLALDETIAAVSVDAVDPLAWPRNYTDERIRAQVLRGISLRRGFREDHLTDIIGFRPAPTVAHGDDGEHQRARALRAGIPGGHFEIVFPDEF